VVNLEEYSYGGATHRRQVNSNFPPNIAVLLRIDFFFYFLLDEKVTKNQGKTMLLPALPNRKPHGDVSDLERWVLSQ
jgi:hypothetical protein